MALKQLFWVGSSKKDLSKLPDEVIDVFGYGLYLAQKGFLPSNAKVLSGFGGAGVIEIKESDKSGTYRAVYTVQMKDTIFVLHVFQKKSKQGIKTSQADIELVKKRLNDAHEIYNQLRK